MPKKYLILVLFMLVISCDDILEVDDISTSEVVILAPKEGSVLTTNTINFNWEEVAEATWYKIQIAQPTFENASQILLDSLIAQDTLGFARTNINFKLLNGNYQWRINAGNSGYSTDFFTSSFLVDGDANVDIIPPNTPLLVAPANNTTQNETTVNFSWTREDISGTAERDSIYIYTDQNLQTLKIKGLGANKTYATTLNANTYYWVVKAYDASNESDISTTFKLTIN